MGRTLCVGNLVAEEGEVARGYLEVPGLPEEAAFPLVLINGRHPGPRLTLIAGIHGFEYAGIAALVRLSCELQPEELHGELVIAPMVNRPAFESRCIYLCPLDGKNLNRVFPGDAQGTASERIARVVYEQLIRPADALVDLHAGDAIEALVPFSIYHVSGNPEIDQQAYALAEAYGLPYVLASTTRGSTYEAAAGAGIPAIIAEVGGQGIYDLSAEQRHLDGIHNVLRHLNMLDGSSPAGREPPTQFYGFSWLFSEYDAMWHPACAVGDHVEIGQKVGELRSYFGERMKEVQAPTAGPVFFLVTSLAIRQGDPLLGIADLHAEPSAPGTHE